LLVLLSCGIRVVVVVDVVVTVVSFCFFGASMGAASSALRLSDATESTASPIIPFTVSTTPFFSSFFDTVSESDSEDDL
jgi:acetyl-CoA carboxylase beta subunit